MQTDYQISDIKTTHVTVYQLTPSVTVYQITYYLSFLCLILFPVFNVNAQQFMPEYSPSFGYKHGSIELKDGSSISGTFTFIGSIGNIKNCTIKDSTDTKHKITAEQIDKVYIKLSKFDKLSTVTESMVSIKKIVNTDFEQVFKAEYFVWEHLINTKNNKHKVLQLVNPGFDKHIKVYHDPVGMKSAEMTVGDVTVTGGEAKSYFIVTQGNENGFRLKKKKYRKIFPKLYADCPPLLEAYKGKKVEWDDFASHVFLYDQLKK